MNIIFLSHWFPPYNEIGAVRPYELVRFLASEGHRVTVITSSGNWSPESYDVDLSMFDVVRVPVPSIVRFAESSPPAFFKRVAKRIFYPDQYILMKKKMIAAALNSSLGGVDLIISSGLPFSTHVVAMELSVKLNVPWIADNRDLWADTPYRRSFLGSERADLFYEKYVLQKASACLVIGDGMAAELRQRLFGKSVEVLMNGADCDPMECTYSDYNVEDVSFSYTGTLYKGRRDLSPLLSALSKTEIGARVNFYGSEPFYIDLMARSYPTLLIKDCGRVGKSDVKKIQKESGFLVLALGNDAFEKTVLTGKFFEYLESGRPIIAICDPDGDLGRLVNGYGVGCASRDVEVISRFVRSVIEKNIWLGKVPLELTRKSQMKKVLPHLIDSVCGRA